MILFSFIVLALLASSSLGRMLESNELLCGDWDVSIRCDSKYFHSDLFPLRRTYDDAVEQPSQRKKSTYSCRLRVYANGTFDLLRTESDDGEARSLLPFRGVWEVKKNPYCVTDRFYDEVIFTSHPRLRKDVSGEEEEAIVKRGLFMLSCRLSGHFSAGRLARRWLANENTPYGFGRLSRGLVFWGDNLTSRGVLKASFTGKRQVPEILSLPDTDCDEED